MDAFLVALFEAFFVMVAWGVTYFWIRRMGNPTLNLKDPSNPERATYFYDAIYGGIAAGVMRMSLYVGQVVFKDMMVQPSMAFLA